MLTPLVVKILAGSALFTLGAAWPIKTIDLADDGANCDDATEQYLQVEGYDFHDYPKFTMHWRQVSGPCGAEVDPSELLSWEATYDVDDGDDYPTDGRVQLNMFLCLPFGEYEIDLDVNSFSDDDSTMQQRTAWELENGPDEYHIWDTVNTDLADVEEYSPTAPGFYTWPIPGTTGYYKIIHAGPMPPLECYEVVPSGAEYAGCFEDSPSSRLLDSDFLELLVKGTDGMSPQVCSDYCADYEYFGVENGAQCFCGTTDLASSASSDNCGVEYADLCTGDATMACGGHDAIAVYQRTGAPSPVPTPSPVFGAPTPSTGSYSLEGCFNDFKDSRLMEGKTTMDVMSAEICFGLCDDGINTHFGTQFSNECWCAVDPDLEQNGEVLDLEECDMACAGTTTDEFCGGHNKITAYVNNGAVTTDDDTDVDALYVGCFQDANDPRAMDAEGKNVLGNMTNELCITFCDDLGHAYAGTQYSEECWCGDSFDRYGSLDESSCESPCQGDSTQACGGFFALSVYSTS